MARVRSRRQRQTAVTEGLIAERWSAALGGVVVRPDDTFYGLGGSSLQVVELLQQIQNEWCLTLTPADLAEHRTLREFAAHIADLHADRFRRRAEATVRLRAGSPGAPDLFCVAGAGASSLSFVRIAESLETDVSVYSLQGRGVEARGWPDWSVPAAVRRHLRTMRRVRPDGPYRLVGHSSGAIIALECARALRWRGAEVAPLVLIDPPVPPRSAVPALDVPKPRVPGAPAAGGADDPDLTARVGRHLRVLGCGLVRYDVHTQQAVTWEHGKRALNRHRLTTFPHPTVVVLSDEYACVEDYWQAIIGPRASVARIGRLHNDVLRNSAAAIACADVVAETALGAGTDALSAGRLRA